MRLTVIFLTEEKYQGVSALLRNYREMPRGGSVCEDFPLVPRDA